MWGNRSLKELKVHTQGLPLNTAYKTLPLHKHCNVGFHIHHSFLLTLELFFCSMKVMLEIPRQPHPMLGCLDPRIHVWLLHYWDNSRRVNTYKAPYPAQQRRLYQSRGRQRKRLSSWRASRIPQIFVEEKGIFYCKVSGNFSPRETCKSHSEICHYLWRDEESLCTASKFANNSSVDFNSAG